MIPEGIIGVAVWFALAGVIGAIARAMGRDGADYFWGSLVLTPILGVYALLVGKRD